MNRPGWEEYVPLFQQMWAESGAQDMQVIVPGEDGKLDMEQADQVLSQATGIFIGGATRRITITITRPVVLKSR